MCEYVTPARLRDVMTRKLEFDDALKDDEPSFVKALCAEAILCQTYFVRERPQNRSKPGNITPSSLAASESASKPTKDKELPVCLLPAHKDKGIRRCLKDCPDCMETERKKIKEDYVKIKKNAKGSGGAKRVEKNDLKDRSYNRVLFNATFGDRIRDVLVADIGADVNVMEDKLLQPIQAAGADIEVCDFPRSLCYAMMLALQRKATRLR
eukprot:Plantae.Rhodophyta-Palmaria_palmata.ctg848.p2 GENE.Plantae.Rhodophyta-Palmaria_palmata.ctg848~~Plantae.Rhodophyta-Palmaria_palmata.ctg848.p2  ORF type:complete len:210 (+),score=40.86 Plantae.Rhodophyta-Palmaria_palmata.ctg848:381-1010(+)